jgi:hypothetical protein
MKAVIDAQLATHGYGKLCFDGPNSPGPFRLNAGSDLRERAVIKQLPKLGFVCVPFTARNSDGSLDTTYDLSASGRASYVTYEKLGWSGDYHGWCFAEFRVGRIVRTPAPCEFMGHRLATVTYYPRIVHVEDWAQKAQATSIPEIRALASFESKTRTQTLMQTSDGWKGTASERTPPQCIKIGPCYVLSGTCRKGRPDGSDTSKSPMGIKLDRKIDDRPACSSTPSRSPAASGSSRTRRAGRCDSGRNWIAPSPSCAPAIPSSSGGSTGWGGRCGICSRCPRRRGQRTRFVRLQ